MIVRTVKAELKRLDRLKADEKTLKFEIAETENRIKQYFSAGGGKYKIKDGKFAITTFV